MAGLRRLSQPLTLTRLEQILAGEEVSTEPVESAADITVLGDAIRNAPEQATGSELDVAMVEPVHASMNGLSRSQAADMRLWHWLTSVAFPDFVWRRWLPRGAANPDGFGDGISDAMFRRFAGTATLNGVSRNTFARLWWTAETLGGDYRLARRALSRQDMFQAVFERHFGIYQPAARAAIDAFDGRREGEIRVAARWLTYVGATTVLEFLNEEQIGSILQEALGAGMGQLEGM